MNIKTSNIALSGVKQLLEWAKSEGWNPGVDDAAAFYAADKHGFLLTTVDDKPAAGISVVKHNDNNSFLGLYLCKPEYRGNNVGLATWNAGMQLLSNTCVGLDGVVEQQSNYQKSGFEFSHRNIRYAGDVGSVDRQSNAIQDSSLASTIRLVNDQDLQALIQLDSLASGYARPAYMTSWLTNTTSRVSMVHSDQSTPDAFATIRRCERGHKIGPVVAGSSDIALQLITALIDHVNATDIIIDVPEPNTAASDIAHALKLSPVFETARMYNSDAPPARIDLQFGLTSFELG